MTSQGRSSLPATIELDVRAVHGVRRVVGDSVEEIGPYDLTLIAGNELEHAWEQGNCTEGDVREITIQFSPDIFPPDLLNRSQFGSIKTMLSKADHGLAFSVRTIMKVYSILDGLSSESEPFDQYLSFLKILYELSQSEDSRILASSSILPSTTVARCISAGYLFSVESCPGDYLFSIGT